MAAEPALPVVSAAPAGPCLLVTRPAAQAAAWVARLRAAGVPAQGLPLIGIGPAPDPDAVRVAWARVRGEAAQGLRPLAVFVSPNAALACIEALAGDALWAPGMLAGATGPGTVAALQAAGVPADAIRSPASDAAQFDSESLWLQLQHEAWAGRPAWIVRGSGGRDWLAATLTAAGARVSFVQSYARGAPVWSPAECALARQAAQDPGQYLWLLSSSEALAHLAALQGPPAPGSSAIATHPRIAAAAHAAGFAEVIEGLPTQAAVVALWQQWRSRQAAAGWEPGRRGPWPGAPSLESPG